MYTVDRAGLVGEYLFDGQIPVIGGQRKIRNTASGPGAAPDGVVIDSDNFSSADLHPSIPSLPLEMSRDTPLVFDGARSLSYNALRKITDLGLVDLSQNSQTICQSLVAQGIPDIENYSQYISVDPFPHSPELTAECWVNVDYMTSDESSAYPNGFGTGFGFGGCPQPMCKAESWYLFLSTARSDRNLVLTTIPGVTQGIPRDGGGILSDDPVAGGAWNHIAFTFKELPPGSPKKYEMALYINGKEDVAEQVLIDNVGGAPGTLLTRRKQTDLPIAEPATNQELRIGVFRDLTPCLDYQFTGKICGVRIYDRALSPEQIALDMKTDLGQKCIKVAKGATTPSQWQQYNPPANTGVYVDVDTSAAGFSTTPTYTSAIYGTSSHWATTGAASIYNATANGFRIYIRRANGNQLTPATAESLGWNIQWIGIEE